VWNSRRVLVIGGTLLGLLALAVVLVPAGRALEQQPGFCASCHIMDTAVKNVVSTGASRNHTTCIECHAGPGWVGTIKAELQGIHEIAAHISGWYSTPLSAQVPRGYCTKCHNKEISLERQHDEVSNFAKTSCGSCHNHQMGTSFNPERRGRRDPFEGTIVEITRMLGAFVKLDVNNDGRADYIVRLGSKTVLLQSPQGAPLTPDALRVGDHLTVIQFNVNGDYYEATQATASRKP